MRIKINANRYLVLIAVACSSCNGNESNKNSNLPVKDTASITGQTLVFENAVKLPEVKGGFDLMALDIKGMRLFLAAEDNHTVEILDLKNKKLLASLPGFNEPKWIVYRPETNRIYVSTGGDGKVTVLDATSYKVIKSFSFKEKCNNLRFDTSKQQLYVGVGNSFGSIGVVDVTSDKILPEIRLADFPKQFELDGNRIYVNVPSRNEIEIIDRPINKVVADWPVKESTGNVPMALDKTQHRLFVACEPGKLIVFNTETGKSVAAVDIHKAADGIYVDAKRSLIYVSCGEGFIDVIQQKSADTWLLVDKVATEKGAGTSLFSPELNQLFLAVPQSEKNIAELRVYNVAK